MPNYLYKCDDSYPHKGCGHEWEETLSVAERIVPMKGKCPECGKKDNIIRVFTSVNIYQFLKNWKAAAFPDLFPEDKKEESNAELSV